MRSTVPLALFLATVLVSSVSSLLMRKGWYRTQNKGPKMTLNNVEYFDDSIVPNSSYLRLNGRIPTLYKGSIKNLSNVTVIKLNFCVIENILPGAFENLPNLATLALLDNEIESIQAGVFNNMNIATLYLQRNQITSIDSKAFDDMPKLYKIKLNYNKLSTWDPEWFHNTPALTEILFRRNEIRTIPSKAFKNIKGSHTYNGTYLVDTKIYLSKNIISVIAPDALEGLEEVSQLWLDRNQLSEIDERVFNKINQISTLFLSKNKLKSLPTSMFPSLSSDIDILDLAGNNNMTCVPYSVVSVVKLTNVQNIRKLECSCVQKLIQQLSDANKHNEIKTDCQSV